MPVLCCYPLADGGLNEQMAYCGDTSFVQSLRERRVVLGFDAALLIVREVALAVGALFSQGQPGLPHGDVSLGHVRLGEKGEVWLTGHITPREGSEAADALRAERNRFTFLSIYQHVAVDRQTVWTDRVDS